MAEELRASFHVVTLVPAPSPRFHGHRIRQAVAFLPDWYRSLMRARPSARHDRRRHFQTAIKRRWTLAGLRAIAAGRRGRYADLLLDAIHRCRADDHAHVMHLEALLG